MYHTLRSPNIEACYNFAPCGLLLYESAGKVVHANDTLLSWLGISLEEVLQTEFIDLLDKGGKLYYQLFVQPLLKMHKEAREIDLNIQWGHRKFPALVSAVLIIGSDKKEYIHAAIYKVGDRKKYESELLKQKTLAEVEEQLKSVTLKEIAFEQAHLVRAPLANILGLLALIDQVEMTDELRDLILMLRQSSEKLDDQVKAIVKKTNR